MPPSPSPSRTVPGFIIPGLFVLSVLGLATSTHAQGPPPVTSITLYCEDGPVLEAVFPDGYVDAFESQYMPFDANGRKHCTAHLGQMVYFVGGFRGLDHVYSLQGGVGEAYIVEAVGFSTAAEVPHVSTERGAAVATEIPIEISMDGLRWEKVGVGHHQVVGVDTTPASLMGKVVKNACDNSMLCGTSFDGQGTLECVDLPGGCERNNMRQQVRFDFTANGQPFRFVRVHNAPSIYTGLAGFMDHSFFTLDVVDLGPTAAPVLTPQVGVAKDCTTDLMEIILPNQPCGYGGYLTEEESPVPLRVGNTAGQWDAPTFFHTYPLGGPSKLDRVAGSVEVRLWRTNPAPAAKEMWVQTSADGATWDTVQVFTVAPVPGATQLYRGSFDAGGLDGKDAAFVRLVAKPMPNWFNEWADRHPWAYFHDSEITLDGQLPP